MFREVKQFGVLRLSKMIAKMWKLENIDELFSHLIPKSTFCLYKKCNTTGDSEYNLCDLFV